MRIESDRSAVVAGGHGAPEFEPVAGYRGGSPRTHARSKPEQDFRHSRVLPSFLAITVLVIHIEVSGRMGQLEFLA